MDLVISFIKVLEGYKYSFLDSIFKTLKAKKWPLCALYSLVVVTSRVKTLQERLRVVENFCCFEITAFFLT